MNDAPDWLEPTVQCLGPFNDIKIRCFFSDAGNLNK